MLVAAVRRGALALVVALFAAAGGLALAGPPAAAAGSVPTAVTPGCDGGEVGVVIAFPGRSEPFATCAAAGGTGIEVLRRAGLAPVVQGFGSVGGGAVCALSDPRRGGEQVGCASGPSCLTCQDPKSWGYYPGYRYSPVGASLTAPAPGAIEAWQWGSATSWSGARVYDLSPPVTTPPTTPTPTTPQATTPPPPATEPAGGGGGTPSGRGTPSGGGGTTPGLDPGQGRATPSTGSPADPGGATTTTRPASSTTSAASSTTTTVAVGRGTDPESEAAATDADGATDGAGDQRAQGVPDGSMSVTEEDGGGSGALVPVATTTGVVAALSVVAVRARRRRAGEARPG